MEIKVSQVTRLPDTSLRGTNTSEHINKNKTLLVGRGVGWGVGWGGVGGVAGASDTAVKMSLLSSR